MHALNVYDVVHGQVLCALPTATVRVVSAAMTEHSIDSALVIEAEHVVGIFTEHDLAGRVVAAGRDLDATLIAEVMSSVPEAIDGAMSVGEALRHLSWFGDDHLTVMDHGKLCGVLSLRDLPALEAREMRHQLAEYDVIAERMW